MAALQSKVRVTVPRTRCTVATPPNDWLNWLVCDSLQTFTTHCSSVYVYLRTYICMCMSVGKVQYIRFLLYRRDGNRDKRCASNTCYTICIMTIPVYCLLVTHRCQRAATAIHISAYHAYLRTYMHVGSSQFLFFICDTLMTHKVLTFVYTNSLFGRP